MRVVMQVVFQLKKLMQNQVQDTAILGSGNIFDDNILQIKQFRLHIVMFIFIFLNGIMLQTLDQFLFAQAGFYVMRQSQHIRVNPIFFAFDMLSKFKNILAKKSRIRPLMVSSQLSSVVNLVI